jgi:hypothetical protein
LFAALVGISFALGPTASAIEKPVPRLVACTWIRTVNQLQAMRNNLGGTYCLANDIDASSKANFIPVGTAAAPFTGRFYGHGHVIRNLTITGAACRPVWIDRSGHGCRKQVLPNVGKFLALVFEARPSDAAY